MPPSPSISFPCQCGKKNLKCPAEFASRTIPCPVDGCGKPTLVPGSAPSSTASLHVAQPEPAYVPPVESTVDPAAAFRSQLHDRGPLGSPGGFLGAPRPSFLDNFRGEHFRAIALALALGGGGGWFLHGYFTPPKEIVRERVVRVPVEVTREVVVPKKAKPRPTIASPIEDEGGIEVRYLMPPVFDGPPKLVHRPGLIRPLDANQSTIKAVDFSEDGRLGFARDTRGEHGRGIVGFDLDSGKLLWGNSSYGTGSTLASSPDSGSIAFGSWSVLRIYDAARGSIRAGFKLGPGPGDGWASSLRWSPDGSRIAVGHDRGGVSVFEVATKSPPLTIETNGMASAVDFTRDGNHLLIGTGGRVVRIHDLANKGIWEREYKGHAHPVYLVRVSPLGNYVASISGGENQAASFHIWDYRTCERVYSALVGSNIACLDLARDWRHIVYSGNDGRLHVWSVLDNKEIEFDGSGHNGAIHSVAISPDGYHALSGGEDRTVRLWGLPKALKTQAAEPTLAVSPAPAPGGAAAPAIATPSPAEVKAIPVFDPDAEAKKSLEFARKNMKSADATYAAERHLKNVEKTTKNPALLADVKKLREQIAELRSGRQ